MILNTILQYFEKISSIPHNTFCEEDIANYIVSFAKDNNLYCSKDKFNNVYIKKQVNNTKPFTLFQAHLDMVCVKEPNYEINFKTDPIKLVKKGNYLTAYKTSLGADNGIGVAIILALLEKAPYNMEALFTTDEEVSTTGATNFDYSQIVSNCLISLDGFRLNEIILGCASICDMQATFTPKFTPQNAQGHILTISGLKGGHSGAQIHKNLGNAIKITCEILKSFNNVKLQNFESGNQFNFIPNYSVVSCLGEKNETMFKNTIKTLKKSYPLLQIKCEKTNIQSTLSQKDSFEVLSFLNKTKTGVLKKNSFGIILSQNLAHINLQEGTIKISQRGQDTTLEEKNILSNKNLATEHNFNFQIFDKKPGFSTSPNCDLVKSLTKLSCKTNHIALKRKVQHVSLEECVFQTKMPNVQMVVVSPKIEFPHSTKERVFLPSIEKTYNLLISYLNNLK